MTQVMVIEQQKQWDNEKDSSEIVSETMYRIDINELIAKLNMSIYDVRLLVNSLVKGKAVELWVKGVDDTNKSVKYIVVLEKGLLSVWISGSRIPF